MVGRFLVLAALVAGGAIAPMIPVSAAPRCAIPYIHGMTPANGAAAEMTVVNDGRPCRVHSYADPDRNLPWTTLGAAAPPQHGTLVFDQPNSWGYLPAPGYAGSDHFIIAGDGRAVDGAPLRGRLSVTVTVTPP